MVDTLLPETAQPEPARQPPLNAVGWARWAWRQLTSMRVALLLLLLLAVAAVPGSVFPQRGIDPAAVEGYLADHPDSGPWLDRVGAFDVYRSPWFSAVYLLLFVSLVGCVLPRARQHWRALRQPPPRTPRRLDRLPGHATATVPVAPDVALDAARQVLRRQRFRVSGYDPHEAGREQSPAAEGGYNSLAAERGYAGETGNLAFHLALLGLLVAVAVGSFTSWSGQATVVEGGTFANVTVGYNEFRAGSRVDPGDLPPFTLTMDSLEVTFDDRSRGNQFGAPRSFVGQVTVVPRPGAAPQRRTLRVNSPVDVDGSRAFLVGNGYAPVVTVRDGSGTVAFSGAVPFLPRDGQYTSVGVVKAPDARPRQIGLTGLFLPTAVVDPERGPISVFPDTRDPRLFLTAWVSRPGQDGLGMNSGVPQSVFVLPTDDLEQLRTPDGEPVRLLLSPGATVSLPDGAGTVTFEGVRRYAALDIRHDPSKGWVLAFSLLALAGVTTSLFVRRRRIWVRVAPDGVGRTVVEVAGLARGDDVAVAPLVRTVRDQIVARAGATATTKE